MRPHHRLGRKSRKQVRATRHARTLHGHLRPALRIELLEDRSLLAADLQLLRDINGLNAADSNPLDITTVGTVVYFTAVTHEHGRELWKSDGTEAGTVLVKDIAPGPYGSYPAQLTNVGGTLFFRAENGPNGRELWKSDGTSAGTVLVKDIRAGIQESYPHNLTSVGNTLYFAANDGSHGFELWKSNGTAAGTVLVNDIRTGVESGLQSFGYSSFANLGSEVFFYGDDGTNGFELWKSNGTAAGTVLVQDIYPGANSSRSYFGNSYLTNVGGSLYFFANDGNHGYELWKSNGTTATLVKDIQSGTGSSGSVFGQNFANVGGTLYFSADDGVSGNELWKSNGTEAGTMIVKDILSGQSSSSPQNLTSIGSLLLFTASDGSNGRELWKSDGSSVGTSLVKDIRTGSDSSNLTYFTNVNGILYFSENEVDNDANLWKSDGSIAGTTLVKSFQTTFNKYASAIRNLTNSGGKLYFSGDDGTTGRELWSSNGSATGTRTVKDIRTGTRDSNPAEFTTIGSAIFFSADDGVHGRELWTSDGTRAGTRLVKDTRVGSTDDYPSPRFLTNVNGTLYFSADDGNNGVELWKSDGTPLGTGLVKDIWAGENGSRPTSLTNLGDIVYFFANDGGTGKELWRSDGTSAGTRLVKDIRSGAYDSSYYGNSLTNVNGTLYFVANDGSNGAELWRSDGTAEGTKMVKDIRSGSANSSPNQLTNVGGTLFFTADDGNSGWELWKSDGTTAGTALVRDFNTGPNGSYPSSLTNVGGSLYFQANDGTLGAELWKSDGTPAGTVLVKDIRAGSEGSFPFSFTNVDGTIYFSAFDGANGGELWKSDGSTSGTVLVKDINSGGLSSYPNALVNAAGVLFFVAEDSTGVRSLWKTDGSTAGTKSVLDPDGNSPNVSFVSEAFGNLFFVGGADASGWELYRLFESVDYGDAPSLTLHGDNGARHNAAGPTLGFLRDSEVNGAPSLSASGDDLAGTDDEDGVPDAPLLIRGKESSVNVSVLNVDRSAAMLNAWIDWNQDGDWDDADEHIVADELVSAGNIVLPFAVPANAKLGPSVARFRLAEESGVRPTGFAFSGEVEDYIFTILEDLSIGLPTGASTNNVVIRKVGSNLKIFNNSIEISSTPVALVNSLQLTGSNSTIDSVVIDYASGGFFSLPGGIDVRGGSGPGDSLKLTGTGQTEVIYAMSMSPLGQTQLHVSDNGSSETIRYSGSENLTFDGLLNFSASDTLNVGSGTLAINSEMPVDLGRLTLLSGGTLSSNGVLSIGAGESLVGSGSVSGRFSGEAGSLVKAMGTLTIGDASSTSGFLTRGDLQVGSNTVTLHDANQAVLGSETIIGASNVPGRITAANGLLVDFGNNLSGFGTLDTPNDVGKFLINNGSIRGNSSSQQITLPGYVKGVGTFNNVNFSGTHSPGLSPARVFYGSASFGDDALLIMELAGGLPGKDYDQIFFSESAMLAGDLEIKLIDGFLPSLGDEFVLLDGDQPLVGQFTNVSLPAAPPGAAWKLTYEGSQLRLLATSDDSQPDLIALGFSTDNSHVLRGQTSVSFTINNAGLAASGNFVVQVVWSDDNVIGNSDDIVVATESFLSLAAGASASRQSLPIQLDRNELFERAKVETPANQEAGFQSTEFERLAIVIDPSNAVVESNESNNFGLGLGIDSANITYFPWDINGNGQVTPTDVIYILNRLGQSDELADLNGNGLVTPTEAISAINRLGYQRNDFSSAPTVAFKTQFIEAALGGTIVLSTGSQATIPAGLLSEDQEVTLVQTAESGEPSPTGLVSRAGDVLDLVFSKNLNIASGLRSNQSEGESGSTIDFIINYGASLPSRINGSLPFAAQRINGITNYFGTPGVLRNPTNSLEISINPSYLSGSNSLTVSAANTAITGRQPPAVGARIWDGTSWQPFDSASISSDKKTLVLTHGVFSSVETAYSTVNAIRDAGGYEQVVGFNYPWRQDIDQSGQQFAQFLDELARIGVRQADLEAHSQGVPVSIAAMARTSESMRIENFVSNGGPLNGTPAANLPDRLMSVLAYADPTWNLVDLALNQVFADIDGLKPDNPALIANRRDAQLKHPETQLIPVVATEPWSLMPSFVGPYIVGCQSEYFDGIICGESADGSQLDWKNRSAAIFLPGKNHNQITGDPDKIEQVGKRVSAGISINPTSGLETNEYGGQATFTIALTSDPQTVVTINLRSDNTTEGTVNPAFVVFASDNWSEPVEVTVTGVDDDRLDGDTIFRIVTDPAETIAQDSPYNGLDAVDVSVVNKDNDEPGITVSPTSGLITTEDGQTATFTIVLENDPGSSVGIDLRSDNIQEGQVSPQLVLFDSNNWSVPQEVTVTGIDDLLADGDVQYQIVTRPALADPGTPYNGLDAEDVSVTNLDNEVSIDVEPTSIEVSENGQIAFFTITLPYASTSPVTIDLTSTDETEGSVSSNSVTFQPGEFVKVVTVTGVDDADVDGDIEFSIVVSPARSEDMRFNGIDPSDVTAVNLDNETALSDVSVVLAADRTRVMRNELVEFTATITNHGPAPAPVEFSDSEIGFGSIEYFMPSACSSVSGYFLNCRFEMAVNQMIVVTYARRAYSNAAPGFHEITATALVLATDPNISNNNGTITIEIQAEGEGESGGVSASAVSAEFPAPAPIADLLQRSTQGFTQSTGQLDSMLTYSRNQLAFDLSSNPQLLVDVKPARFHKLTRYQRRLETQVQAKSTWLSNNTEFDNLLTLLAEDIAR
ncbi:MAG: hypothetical protein KDB22_03335 [Planctomycetales bacterium]|nr:hypothetical protein [Planctomycetales bacterium]